MIDKRSQSMAASVFLLNALRAAAEKLAKGTKIDHETLVLGMAEVLGDMLALTPAPMLDSLTEKAFAEVTRKPRYDDEP
jgi:hypothetical protein